MSHRRRSNFFIPGEKIRGMRLAINMTSKEMANRVGVSRVTYSGWENSKGRPSFSQFMTICDVCGIKGLDLFMESLNSIAEVYLDSDGVASDSRHKSSNELLHSPCPAGVAGFSAENGVERKRASSTRASKDKNS